jgi:hypothetical protein
MKFRSLLIILSVFILPGCISSYFSTANDVCKTQATVVIADGTETTGQLTVLFENNIDAKKTIDLFYKETGKTEKINAETIRYYKIKNNYYVPKKIDLHLDGHYHLLFVKLLSAENSKIRLYQLTQKFKSTPTGENWQLYYISLPSFSKFEVWSTYSQNLSPHFELKMSQAVADCPALAKKIESKTKGYYIPDLPPMLFADAKRIEVYQRIIAEYDSCR